MVNAARIPAILITFRLVVAPLLVLDALDHQVTSWFIVGYLLAILSDICDGIVARRLGVSTSKLRQADSWADICLFLALAVSTFLVHPRVFTEFRLPLLVATIAQATLFLTNLIKFGKLPCFHTYTAKAWGLTLVTATVGLFVFGNAMFLWLAIAMCLVNSCEEMIMTLILPQWTHDVPSLFHTFTLYKS
jgi:phosphatidylglycerophosphate synthase